MKPALHAAIFGLFLASTATVGSAGPTMADEMPTIMLLMKDGAGDLQVF